MTTQVFPLIMLNYGVTVTKYFISKKIIVSAIVIIFMFVFLLMNINSKNKLSAKSCGKDKTSMVQKCRKNSNYNYQLSLYDIYKTGSADVVMLGNSITYGINWNELLCRDKIVNRGINSDIVEGFLNRIEYVIKLHPKLCFIMGGINDIYNDIPVDLIFQNYKKIVETLKENDITPTIQSTLYVSIKWHGYKDKNPEVGKLNELLCEYSKEIKIDFLDLNLRLSRDGILIEKYTHDGVHLNAEGYRIWGKEVDNVLKKYGI